MFIVIILIRAHKKFDVFSHLVVKVVFIFLVMEYIVAFLSSFFILVRPLQVYDFKGLRC